MLLFGLALQNLPPDRLGRLYPPMSGSQHGQLIRVLVVTMHPAPLPPPPPHLSFPSFSWLSSANKQIRPHPFEKNGVDPIRVLSLIASTFSTCRFLRPQNVWLS